MLESWKVPGQNRAGQGQGRMDVGVCGSRLWCLYGIGGVSVSVCVFAWSLVVDTLALALISVAVIKTRLLSLVSFLLFRFWCCYAGGWGRSVLAVWSGGLGVQCLE